MKKKNHWFVINWKKVQKFSFRVFAAQLYIPSTALLLLRSDEPVEIPLIPLLTPDIILKKQMLVQN